MTTAVVLLPQLELDLSRKVLHASLDTPLTLPSSEKAKKHDPPMALHASTLDHKSQLLLKATQMLRPNHHTMQPTNLTKLFEISITMQGVETGLSMTLPDFSKPPSTGSALFLLNETAPISLFKPTTYSTYCAVRGRRSLTRLSCASNNPLNESFSKFVPSHMVGRASNRHLADISTISSYVYAFHIWMTDSRVLLLLSYLLFKVFLATFTHFYLQITTPF